MSAWNINDLGAYALAITDEWDRRRGRQLPPAGNLEYMLIRRLWDERVPLRIVLQGIRDCGGTREADSLLYGEPAIRAEINRWSSAQVL